MKTEFIQFKQAQQAQNTKEGTERTSSEVLEQSKSFSHLC